MTNYQRTLEVVLEMLFARFGYQGEALEEFAENFFTEGGSIMVPEECDYCDAIFQAKVIAPEWLRIRGFEALEAGQKPEAEYITEVKRDANGVIIGDEKLQAADTDTATSDINGAE